MVVPVAVVWLVFHMLVATGTTILVLAAGSSTSEIVCKCAHGADHRLCPMHKTPKDSARCYMESTQEAFGLALLSVLAPLTPSVTTSEILGVPARLPIGYPSRSLSDRTVPPEPPPPRS